MISWALVLSIHIVKGTHMMQYLPYSPLSLDKQCLEVILKYRDYHGI